MSLFYHRCSSLLMHNPHYKPRLNSPISQFTQNYISRFPQYKLSSTKSICISNGSYFILNKTTQQSVHLKSYNRSYKNATSRFFSYSASSANISETNDTRVKESIQEKSVGKSDRFHHEYDENNNKSKFTNRALIVGIISTSALIGSSIYSLHFDHEDSKTAQELKYLDTIYIQDTLPQTIDKSIFHKCLNFIKNSFLKFIYLLRLIIRTGELICIFGPVIATFPIWFITEYYKLNSEDKVPNLWWINFLILGLEYGGPTFTKLGQWASSRSDLFPLYICDQLTKLQANVRPHSFNKTKKTFEKEYGKPLEDIFEEFSEKPIGVGCIAQVYEATINKQIIDEEFGSVYKGSRKCAVKVIHPGVANTVNMDLSILTFFGSIINRIPTLEWLSVPDEIAAFSSMMKEQLDMKFEGTCLTRFEKNFIENPNIYFPLILPNYAKSNILIESCLYGIPLTKFLSSQHIPYNKVLAKTLWEGFLQMLVIDNFVHADLHPGNVVVTFRKPDGSEPPVIFRRLFGINLANKLFFRSFSHISPTVEPELYMDQKEITELSKLSNKEFRKQLDSLFNDGWEPVLLMFDAGMVSELSTLNLHNFLDLFAAVARFDGKRCAELLVERSRTPWTVINFEQFNNKMDEFLSRIREQTLRLSKIQVGEILGYMFGMVREHHIKLEGDYTNIGVGMMLLEGTEKRLDADIDLLQLALPVLLKGATERSQTEYDILQEQDRKRKKLMYIEYEYKEKARKLWWHPLDLTALTFEWSHYWIEHMYEKITGLEPTYNHVPTNLIDFLKFTADVAANTTNSLINGNELPATSYDENMEEDPYQRRAELKKLVSGPAYIKLWLYYRIRPFLILPDIISDIDLYEQALVFFSE